MLRHMIWRLVEINPLEIQSLDLMLGFPLCVSPDFGLYIIK